LQPQDSTKTADGEDFGSLPDRPERVVKRRLAGEIRPLHTSAAREYWFYRELFFFFVWRDIKVRYKQTMLGAYWAVLQPFLTMIVFTLLFGKVAGLSSDGMPRPIFYYAGLLPWTYFSTSFNKASLSLTGNVALITKVYFPRALIPTSAVLTGLLDFAIASVLLFIMMPFFGMSFHPTILLWPVLQFPLIVLALGMGLFLSALNVSYRDVKHTVPFMVQIGLFLSAVVLPVSQIPEAYRPWTLLNPVIAVIEACRAVVAGRPVDWMAWVVSIALSLLVLAGGYLYFRKAERLFADTI